MADGKRMYNNHIRPGSNGNNGSSNIWQMVKECTTTTLGQGPMVIMVVLIYGRWLKNVQQPH